MSTRSAIAHREEGQGDPIVLLNGVAMSALAWQPVVSVLRARLRVMTCDFRGQLLSPGSPRASFSENASDVIAAMDERGIERAAICGTSFGGAVALALAAEHPERVSALIVIAAAPVADAHLLRFELSWRTRAEEAARGGPRRPLFEQLFADAYGERYLAENRAEIEAKLDLLGALPASFFESLLGLFDVARGLDLRGALGRITCPTLVIAAEDDRVVDPAATQAIAAGIAGARFEIVPRAGHAVVMERPVEIAARLLRFLEHREL